MPKQSAVRARLDEELHRQLRARARAEGRSESAILRQALEFYLPRVRAETVFHVSEPPPPAYGLDLVKAQADATSALKRRAGRAEK